MLSSLSVFAAVCISLTTAQAPNLMGLLAERNATIMIDLIETAQLSNYVAMNGPLTVICPSDEAFRKQPANYIDNLKLNKAKLVDYVKYHLVVGDIFSWDISSSTVIRALNGHILRFYYYAEHFGQVPVLHVNSATVIHHDLQARNGVVQIVDEVLAPPEGSVEEVLMHNHNLSIITNLTFISHLNRSLSITRAGHRRTLFAPTDEAFRNMDQAFYRRSS